MPASAQSQPHQQNDFNQEEINSPVTESRESLTPKNISFPPEILLQLKNENLELQKKIAQMDQQLQAIAQTVQQKIDLSHDPARLKETNLKSLNGFGLASSKIYSSDSSLTIGTSAELMNLVDDRGTDTPTLNSWKVSPHVGYRFNQDFLFNARFTFENTGSEIHSGGSNQKGQSRVDFAYLDFVYKPHANLRIGQQLLPIGWINQRQDGIFYFTVNPPEVETLIIPSTWSENGVTLWGRDHSFHYQVGAFNSLNAKNFTENNFIRGGRQGGQLTKLENIAGIGRIDFINDRLILGGSAFVGSTSQNQATVKDGTVLLYETHMDLIFSIFHLMALYTRGHIEDPESISIIASGNPTIPSDVNGYYILLSTDLRELFYQQKSSHSFPFFVMHSQYDLNSGMPEGKNRDPLLQRTLTTVGFNYRPEQRLAFKMDYQFRQNKKAKEQDIFSFGVSLVF